MIITKNTNGGKNMKSGNAIIIALIVIIIAVLGIFFFIIGDGITHQDNQMAEPASDIGSTSLDSGVSTDSQSSDSDYTTESSTSSDISDSDSQESEDTDDSGSAPQAGQAEGTYDPTDFD